MSQRSARRKRSFHPCFSIIVTTLAIAVAPACGGALKGDGTDNAAGSEGTTATGAAGTSSSAGSGGTSGTTGGTGGTSELPSQACPLSEPVGGSPCFGTRFPPCSYSVCCGHTYGCRRGTWQHTDFGTCSTPPPSCPARAPEPGEACCFSAPLAASCSYGCYTAPDGGTFSLFAWCNGNHWYVERNPSCIEGD